MDLSLVAFRDPKAAPDQWMEFQEIGLRAFTQQMQSL